MHAGAGAGGMVLEPGDHTRGLSAANMTLPLVVYEAIMICWVVTCLKKRF